MLRNILISGPTGSGKTYLVRTMAKMLGVPFAKDLQLQEQCKSSARLLGQHLSSRCDTRLARQMRRNSRKLALSAKMRRMLSGSS